MPEIGSEHFRYGEHELPVRQFEQCFFRKMFRKQEESFLMTARAKIPLLARERSEIFVIAFVIRAGDSGYAFCVITAVQKPLNRTGYSIETEFPECSGIGLLIYRLKFMKMIFEDLLNDIPGSWFVVGF